VQSEPASPLFLHDNPPSGRNPYHHTAITDNPVNQIKSLTSTTGTVGDSGECFSLDKWCVFG
jgi:hypothetical protein